MYLRRFFYYVLIFPLFQAKQLTRAVATLLYFTRDEEKLLREHLEWKMSWFGSKPDLGSGQFSLSIEPS